MSESTENLDKAQKNQKRVGASYRSDPESTGPAKVYEKQQDCR